RKVWWDHLRKPANDSVRQPALLRLRSCRGTQSACEEQGPHLGNCHMRDFRGRGARCAAVVISAAVTGSLWLGASAYGQEAAAPAELPPIEVSAQTKKKAAPAKKKATAPKPKAPAAAVATVPVDTGTADEPNKGLSFDGLSSEG